MVFSVKCTDQGFMMIRASRFVTSHLKDSLSKWFQSLNLDEAKKTTFSERKEEKLKKCLFHNSSSQ